MSNHKTNPLHTIKKALASKKALPGGTGKHLETEAGAPFTESCAVPEARGVPETRGVLEWVPWETCLPGAGEEARIERWRRQSRPNPR